MTYIAKYFSDMLRKELEKGYDVLRISRIAFQFYQKHGRELTPNLDEKILQLMAMEEGPEFEFSEEEIWRLVEELASEPAG